MKRTLIILTLLLACISLFAQQKTAKVTLKNGTSFSGIVTDFDPTSHVTIIIAGFEKKIDMSEVESVEDLSIYQASQTVDLNGSASVDLEKDLPSSYTIKVGPYEIEMVLVRGATFAMGYDGPGSRSMFSEPVHDVKLSSFYINKEPLSRGVVGYLKDGAQEQGEKAYSPNTWKDANEIVEKLAERSGLPIHLITEAQWEYTATTQGKLFAEMERNHCYDYIYDFISNNTVQIDPTGPQKGTQHMYRTFSTQAEILFDRGVSRGSGALMKKAIRFTFPASYLLKEDAE